jgi:hypothetical protein
MYSNEHTLPMEKTNENVIIVYFCMMWANFGPIKTLNMISYSEPDINWAFPGENAVLKCRLRCQKNKI